MIIIYLFQLKKYLFKKETHTINTKMKKLKIVQKVL